MEWTEGDLVQPRTYSYSVFKDRMLRKKSVGSMGAEFSKDKISYQEISEFNSIIILKISADAGAVVPLFMRSMETKKIRFASTKHDLGRQRLPIQWLQLPFHGGLGKGGPHVVHDLKDRV